VVCVFLQLCNSWGFVCVCVCVLCDSLAFVCLCIVRPIGFVYVCVFCVLCNR
jgi:hypothetical protein